MEKFVPSPQNPAFCFIAPTPYLNDFVTGKTRAHLVLAHIIDKDPAYRDYYRARSEAGDFIMCDNSAYELHESWNPSDLLKVADSVKADAIVLPDYPFQPAEKTIEAAEQYAPMFRDNGFKTFFVPQSERGDIDDWVDAYDYAADSDLIDIIGLSILGIPNALPHIDPAYARVVMVQLLKDSWKFCSKHHHALGLNAGPKLEIPSLIRMGAIGTIDSSGPIWSAILGHEYNRNTDSLQSTSKIKLPVDFNLPMTKDKETIKRINHNINLTLELFETAHEQSDWFAKE